MGNRETCVQCKEKKPGRLDQRNECADCAPVTTTCALGEPCEWDRLHNINGHGCENLSRLRLCKAHAKAVPFKPRKP